MSQGKPETTELSTEPSAAKETTPSVPQDTSRISQEMLHILETYLEKGCSLPEAPAFKETTLPFILRLAALSGFAPLKEQLAYGEAQSLSLNRADIAVLLAAGLVGCVARFTFDFKWLVYSVKTDSRSQGAKIDCLFAYFEQVRTRVGDSALATEDPKDLYASLKKTFPDFLLVQKRKVPINTNKFWKGCTKHFCAFNIFESGAIEDGDNTNQIDFANKYIGGGVLQHGCVQEEIRFVISPEYLASMYYVEGHMVDDECIVFLGGERFSNYGGYGKTFHYAGAYDDKSTNKTIEGKSYRNTTMTAIDALPGLDLDGQFSKEIMLREINKAHIGFMLNPWEDTNAPVSTGNWGCGAFGGNIQLKSLLQWMAASAAGRESINYYTFKDKGAAGLKEVVDAILAANLTVADLWYIIKKYDVKRWDHNTLFAYILKVAPKKSKPQRSGSFLSAHSPGFMKRFFPGDS